MSTNTSSIHEASISQSRGTTLASLLLGRIVGRRDWEGIAERIRSHPHEALLWRGSKKSSPGLVFCSEECYCAPTPIHFILFCEGATEGAVRAAVDACPGHLRIRDEDGDLPLHVACYGGDSGRREDIFRLVLDAYPEAASSKNRLGRTPLHLVLNTLQEVAPGDGDFGRIVTITTRTVGFLMGASPSSLLESDIYGDTPMNLVEVRWYEHVRTEMAAFSSLDYHSHCQLSWKLAMDVLRATYFARRSESNLPAPTSFLRLHAAIDSCVDLEVVKQAISNHRHELHRKDDDGRLPLHVAITRDVGDHAYTKELIDLLLRLAPSAAAVPDGGGRLPLHLAAESGMLLERGVDGIFDAAPRALETRCTSTRMYPFMAAAVGEDSDVNSVYFLLRQNPTLASGLERTPWNVERCALCTKVAELETHRDELITETSKLKRKLDADAREILELKRRNAELERRIKS